MLPKGICVIRNFAGTSSSRFCSGFKFFMQISCIDQQKAAFPNINTTLVCFCSGGKIVPNKVKARWTNTRLQASCSSAVSFLNKVLLGVFNESVVWFNDSLIKKQSLVAIYWRNNVTCRKSHFKNPWKRTNRQTSQSIKFESQNWKLYNRNAHDNSWNCFVLPRFLLFGGHVSEAQLSVSVPTRVLLWGRHGCAARVTLPCWNCRRTTGSDK